MESDDRPNETARLAKQAGGGDDESFGGLYERVAPAIYAYACPRVGWNSVDAEDVVAETWLRARQKFSSYDAHRPFRHWVFGFARRVVYEVQKERARTQSPGDAASRSRSFDPDDWGEEATSVSRRVARREELRGFVLWMRELTRYEREVLLLRGLEGLPHEVVATTLGRTKGAVERCWKRIRLKVQARGGVDGLLAE